MQLTFVAGARPNFMKVAPLLLAARQSQACRAGSCTPVSTTTSRCRTASSTNWSCPGPTRTSASAPGTHAAQTARVMAGFDDDARPASAGCSGRGR